MNKIAIAIIVYALFLQGCSSSRVASDYLPGASYVELKPTYDPSTVTVFRNGQMPDRAFILVANIGAHGNGYADRSHLESRLIKQAADLGANILFVTDSEITKDETVGVYGGGTMVASQVQRPHLYGVAAVWGKSSLGVSFDMETRKLLYVAPGSAAEKAGLKEGQEVLSVDNVFLQQRAAMKDILDRKIISQEPGTVVQLRVKPESGDKFTVSVTLQAAG